MIRSKNWELEVAAQAALEKDLETFDKSQIILLAGSFHPALAQAVFQLLGLAELFPIIRFPDNEIGIVNIPNLRGRDVVVMNPAGPPLQDTSFMEMLVMLDAVQRASAGSITAVMPYMPYQRQDRKDKPRAPITSALLSNMLVLAGADRLLTIDNHAPQAQGYINRPWDELYASYVIMPYLRSLKLNNLVVLSPDAGGVKKSIFYARTLQAGGTAYMNKVRDVKNGDIDASTITGKVDGMDVLIVDDMLVGGGTLFRAADLANAQGANRVVAAVTHGLFIGDVVASLDKSSIDTLIVTNTLPIAEEIESHPKVVVLSVARLLSQAIIRTQTGDSLSELTL